ncbi:predicted protein [Arabidopsis lyrata subsp. lyrata]|uniref:Predicted protein n=1 Tax=Arabidopsis lyrata subsp. lyrata TaxID=81972 RepID=D7LMF4_ARALL|nr:predicted protein [Arabidopsis lyrata subsp. lyrata]
MAISFISLALLSLSVLLISLSIRGVTATKLQHNEGEARKMYERWLLDNEKNYKVLERRRDDLTDDEYQSIYLGGKVERTSLSLEWEWDTSNRYRYKEGDNLPDEVDWRERGAVVEQEISKNLRGCWAFSAAGAVEGINQITTGELISLSEQQLIDCATETNDRCDGGDAAYAFMFIKENGGIVTNKDYPFTGDKNATCKAIEKDGVFTGPCDSTLINHNVLVVGYGTNSTTGQDYWLIRNSFGSTWGENGYFRLQRSNIQNSTGICGVTLTPVYPLKSNSSFDLLSPSVLKLVVLFVFELIGLALF